MKHTIRFSIAGIMLMALLLVSSSTVFGYGSLDYYYNSQIKTEHWENTTNIPWYIDAGGYNKYYAACQASFNTWENITYTDLTFQYQGTTSQVWDEDDGINVVSFNSGYINWGGVLGFTVNYTVQSTGEIYGFDIIMNPRTKWSTDGTPRSNQYELEAVVTHELGHAQGLAHTVVATATMYPFGTPGDVSPITLEHDDLISIALLYGNSSFPGPYAQFQGSVVRGGTGNVVPGAAVQTFPPDVQYYSENITSVYTYSSGTYTLYAPAGDYLLRLDPLDGDPAAYDPNRINYVLMAIAEADFPAEWYNDGEGNCEDNTLATTYTIAAGQVRTGFTFVTNENCGGSPPVADFSGSPISGTVPLLVDFTDLSSNNPTSWSWDFGDGVGTSTDQNPSYTYENTGQYTVTLTATNTYGSDSEIKTDYITVTSGGETYLHVADIVVTRKVAGPNNTGIATVTIVDQNDAVVSGATVYGFFNAPNTDTKSGITGADGVASINSDKTKSPPSDWCFEVTNVELTGATYDPGANVVTRACESGPVFKAITALPESYQLMQNVPNPFNPSTAISFILPRDEHVTLEVYNIAGRKVETLVNRFMPAGTHTVEWNASDYSSGVYLYRLTTDGLLETRKMILLK